MSLYTKDSIDKLKDSVDMVELVGGSDGPAAGGHALQPACARFTRERTPSFSVNAEHKLYHCFGCGARVTSIGFVQETEGLDFKQAIEALADRYNVRAPSASRRTRPPSARRERRERLLKLVQRATDYYARVPVGLRRGQARARVPGRAGARGAGAARLSRRVCAERVGTRSPLRRSATASPARRSRAAGLGQRGAAAAAASTTASGPASCSPLADPRGRVLGFGARAVRDEQQPKYLNTSENELYHKGRQLFGIDLARGPAAKRGRILVVEGYTDVLALHQAGLSESVAIMGTAVTPEQVTLLAQTTNTVFLALDADRSGQEAMLRASRIAADRGVELRVVEMPDGTDPADLVAERVRNAFTELLGNASSVVEFQVRRVLADSDLQTPVAGTGRSTACAR